MENVKNKRNPLLHVTRRLDVSNTRKWLTRIAAIISGFLLCGIIANFMGTSFPNFFVKIFEACFVNLKTGGLSATKITDLLENMIILLVIAIALIPAFKMKFWNIGAEGQIAISILVCAIMQKYVGSNMNVSNVGIRILFFAITLIACLAAGALWGVIPALFRAKFNTNETLFTLMMNYIALLVTKSVIMTWDPTQGSIQPFADELYLPKIGNQQGVINIIIGVVVVIGVAIYLYFSKHGYEINVVGGSRNTAKYVGISVKKVIIRTMILSGAICGLVGFMLVCGEHNNLTATIVNGRGFTGVMIAWIAGLGPIQASLYAFLCAFITKGSRTANYNVAFPNVMLAVMFFVLIAFEFFVNYRLRSEKIETFFKDKFTRKKKGETQTPQIVKKEEK